MKYKIEEDRLIITISRDEQRAIQRRYKEDEFFQSDATMEDFFEPLVCNSELDWVSPQFTGDLTSAPMLGIHGEEEDWNDDLPNSDSRPILYRWAYMDYALRSPLEDLRLKREVIFQGGECHVREGQMDICKEGSAGRRPCFSSQPG